MNGRIKNKWSGLQHDQSTFPNAQLRFPSVWSDWLIDEALLGLLLPREMNARGNARTIWLRCISLIYVALDAHQLTLENFRLGVKLLQLNCFLPDVVNPAVRSSITPSVGSTQANFLSLVSVMHRQGVRKGLVGKWGRNWWEESESGWVSLQMLAKLRGIITVMVHQSVMVFSLLTHCCLYAAL